MTKYQDIAMMLEANAITNTVDAYNKGRADKYKEITSEYMLLTEKQVEEIRTEAIEEVRSKMISFHTDAIFQYGADTIEARADAFDELKDWLKEQMKEQKNEQSV